MKELHEKIQLEDFPSLLHPFLQGSRIFDSSSHSGAIVWYLDKGYYLKMDEKGKLAQEALLAKWFESQQLGVPVISYFSEDKDYLLTQKANGKPAHHYLENPKKLCQIMAHTLRKLHSMKPNNFPLTNRLEQYKSYAETAYQAGNFYDKALIPRFGITNRKEAYELIKNQGHRLKADTFIHGDFCLPNLILKGDYQFSSLIDVGLAGMSDRHIDLFWAIWSLHYNLGTDSYTDYFLDCYGRQNIDESKLALVAAFEAFG